MIIVVRYVAVVVFVVAAVVFYIVFVIVILWLLLLTRLSFFSQELIAKSLARGHKTHKTAPNNSRCTRKYLINTR